MKQIIAYPDGNVKRIITLAYEVEVEPFIELVCSEESREIRFIPKGELENLAMDNKGMNQIPKNDVRIQ